MLPAPPIHGWAMTDLKANAVNFPIFAGARTPIVLSTYHRDSMGSLLAASIFGAAVAPASSVWPLANEAMFVPFQIHDSVTAYQLAVMKGADIGDNLDIGIYDAAGVRRVSAGSTAQSAGLNALQVFDIPDTPLEPGRYYLAVVMDGITGQLRVSAPDAPFVGYLSMCGIAVQTSAFPLPATVTLALNGRLRFPLACVSFRATPAP